ncbi:MAG: transcription termination/antitermination protein NusA, partial [Leptospiraceae bacterium]|nr:transcription termination/antitermination protein NusA [Leptospiraceae bacterium]
MARSTRQKSQSGPDIRAFYEYIDDISREKGLDRDEVLDVIRSSLITAYQKKHGQDANLEVIMDRENAELWVIHRRTVVDDVVNPDAELTLEQARVIKPDAKPGEVLEDKENPFEFSRIGATNVRQILLQRLKELEREIIYNEFKKKEGDLINGYFLRWRDRDMMYVDLGRAEGILPRREQIPGERFRNGDRVKAIIKTVELRREKSREPGPFITLSRSSPDFVRKLFEMEIPEIYEGVVEILTISRQPGYRTKLLVRSNRSDVDPVGACVGIKGVRIQSIVRELGNERIDIVNFSEDAEELIANALSPARVLEVKVDPRAREALVVVPDDAYSLAIGNNGQNVRLASQLTEYRLLVKSQTQFSEEMSSPEARAQLEALFNPPETGEEEEFTALSDLPGLT